MKVIFLRANGAVGRRNLNEGNNEIVEDHVIIGFENDNSEIVIPDENLRAQLEPIELMMVYKGLDIDVQDIDKYVSNHRVITIPYTGNLMIVGANDYVGSKTLLANRFSFTEDDIADFHVVGNGIVATVTKTSYSTNNMGGAVGSFRDHTGLISVVETAGYFTWNYGSSFNNCTNLNLFDCVGMTGLEGGFVNCPNLSLENINVNNVESLGGFALASIKPAENDNVIIFPKLKSTGTKSFYENNYSLDLPVFDTIGTQTFNKYYGQTLKMPSLIDIPDGQRNWEAVKAGAQYYFNIALQTSDAGATDTDIVEADTNGAIINWL